MSLTALMEQQLHDAGLIQHFNDHRSTYAEHARQAYNFAWGYVTPTGLPVRMDDVIVPLKAALRVSEPLRSTLAEKRCTQQYWPERFGHLILDRLWEELTDHDVEPEQ